MCSEVLGIPGENHLFQNISHGGSRDALVHLLPMDPSAKEFQDSDRGETPNGVRMFVNGFPFFRLRRRRRFLRSGSPSGRKSGFPAKCPRLPSAHLAAGRRLPSLRISKCFCGRLQILPKAPSVKNRNILPGGDRRTAAGRSMVFHFLGFEEGVGF